MTAGFSAASGSSVSRLFATLCFVSRFAAISAAAIHVVDGSQSGELRFTRFSRAMQGRFGRAFGLVAGRRRFSPIKFFLTKNPLPAAIDSTERACGLRPCR
ncbi:hypothetical protein [Caballeronia catudaia]|uniref:hypothetical protein n=1 Tax=Caballeronia catudaia TaxID=1777136 RepID=UPI001180C3B3|nr:hypothetical protein [Caballeronia catudaia]